MSAAGFPLISFGLGSLGKSIAEAIFSVASGLESSLVTSLVRQVMDDAVSSTTNVPLGTGSWFASAAARMAPVAELVVVPLLFAATIGAIARQDLKRLGRAWAVGLPVSGLGGYAVVQLSQVGLRATDALSAAVEQQVSPGLGETFAKAVSLGAGSLFVPGGLGALGALLGLVVIAGGLALWLELALRSAAIELAVFFMPLALSGLVWPATARWARRLLELLGALLMCKPVIVGALCLGADALTSGQATAESVVTGAAVLLLAAFAPLALLKLVPLVEASAVAHLGGLGRQPVVAAERAVQWAMAAVARGSGAGAEPGLRADDGGPATATRLLAGLQDGVSTITDWGPAGSADG